MENRVLILASVASMIDQFNMPNIKLLKKLGYEVHIACNFIEGNTCSEEQIVILKNNLSKANIEFHQIDFQRNVMRFKDNVKAYKQVHELVVKYKYKFLHCHSPIGGVVGRLVGKTTNTKVIYTAHGFHFYKGAPLKNWLVYYPVERWLSKYTDTLITINREDYKRSSAFKARKKEYIHGIGIDISKFELETSNRLKIRKSINVNEDELLVLSVGELNRNKNHQVIIKAIAELRDKKIKYVICGQGSLRDELIKLSKELKVDHQVEFLGFRSDIPELMDAADIYAFPSFREGLSVSLMEAMASGLPVVCSNIRGNSDLIVEDNGGYLIQPSDYLEASKKINKLYKSEEFRNKLGDYNKLYITKFSVFNVMDEMLRIYKEM